MAVRSVLRICLSLLVLMSFGTGDAFAWGNEGHRIVCPGYIVPSRRSFAVQARPYCLYLCG